MTNDIRISLSTVAVAVPVYILLSAVSTVSNRYLFVGVDLSQPPQAYVLALIMVLLSLATARLSKQAHREFVGDADD